MIREPRPAFLREADQAPRRCFSMPPAVRRVIKRPVPLMRCCSAMASAVLLTCGLLAAAGCGQDDQRVPESFPSGARPAPAPDVDLKAAQAELPPAPPSEPTVEPTPASKQATAPPGKPAMNSRPSGRRSGDARQRLSG